MADTLGIEPKGIHHLGTNLGGAPPTRFKTTSKLWTSFGLTKLTGIRHLWAIMGGPPKTPQDSANVPVEIVTALVWRVSHPWMEIVAASETVAALGIAASLETAATLET